MQLDELIQDLIEDLKIDEGSIKKDERHVLYDDHLGYKTIGYGRLLDPEKPGAGISDDEADFLLQSDVRRIVDELDRALPWWRSLSDNAKLALMNQSFQLGLPTLLTFKNQLQAMQDGNMELAAEHALDSKWAKQDTPQRAQRVATLMKTA